MATYNFHNFNQKAKALFQPTLERYGYVLAESKVNDIKGVIWSIHHIYINSAAALKIVIKQEPYYTDYGFSFFIFKLGTNQYNILCNVPHENQDKSDNFLYTAYEDLFSTPETADLITGKLWKELRRIPIQK